MKAGLSLTTLLSVGLWAHPCYAESDADQSARLCRNAVVTFAARDPIGENAREDCENGKPTAHTPQQWKCVLDTVTDGLSFYTAQKQCFTQQ